MAARGGGADSIALFGGDQRLVCDVVSAIWALHFPSDLGSVFDGYGC